MNEGIYTDTVVKEIVFKDYRHDIYPDDIMYLLRGKFCNT